MDGSGSTDPEFPTSNSAIVSCTPDFWRYGNVKIFADRCGTRVVDGYSQLLAEIEDELERSGFDFTC